MLPSKTLTIKFTVNGKLQTIDVFPMARLLDVLREQLRLTGTKEGCGEGECGACTVLLNGEIVNSCLVPMAQVEGSQITTIEGVANGDELHAVQQAFIEHGGAQCGICTPGMVLAAVDLVIAQSEPYRRRHTHRPGWQSLSLHGVHEDLRIGRSRLSEIVQWWFAFNSLRNLRVLCVSCGYRSLNRPAQRVQRLGRGR